MTMTLSRATLLAVGSAAALSLAACSGDDSATKNDAAGAATSTTAKLDQIAPPAGKKWTEVVTRTPEGNYVMGNPDAKVKLIEYGSLTCSHCAEFSKESSELESVYVASGQVAFELRNYVRDPFDMTAAMLARCSGPDRYFPLMANVFASQEDMFKQIQSADQNALQNVQALPANNRPGGIAKATGLDKFFKARGMTDAEINQCFASPKDMEALVKTAEEANGNPKFTGTPAFILGSDMFMLEPGQPMWGQVKAKLDAALN